MTTEPLSTDEAMAHVFHAWDAALGARDIDAAMALYHPDVTLESPLVCHLLGAQRGIVHGRAELRAFVEKVFEHQPPQRGRFRAGYLSDGRRLTWEYPRQTPDGEQMDIVELMEIRDGLIAAHRIYWGWYSVGMLADGTHSS